MTDTTKHLKLIIPSLYAFEITDKQDDLSIIFKYYIDILKLSKTFKDKPDGLDNFIYEWQLTTEVYQRGSEFKLYFKEEFEVCDSPVYMSHEEVKQNEIYTDYIKQQVRDLISKHSNDLYKIVYKNHSMWA